MPLQDENDASGRVYENMWLDLQYPKTDVVYFVSTHGVRVDGARIDRLTAAFPVVSRRRLSDWCRCASELRRSADVRRHAEINVLPSVQLNEVAASAFVASGDHACAVS